MRYETIVKPIIDKVLSFIGLVILSPLYILIALAIYVDDPGPVFFTQKRVGKDKHLFALHKFRTMKLSTPHDVPTHQLSNPEQYITCTGRFLRKYSLDELPQIWDIFCGRMSIIGPWPALWNQEDLIAEREKYCANSVFPGLTGLAQIKGRDELEISHKAKLDGEYVRLLRKGGIVAFIQDIWCFINTIGSVLKHDGVVEGGTGKINSSEADLENYGYRKVFNINKSDRKRILITGANSYIGDSFASYVEKYYPNLSINIIDMKDGSWRVHDFGSYDTVFHVAGIAHSDAGLTSGKKKDLYYAVNTELAIETAKKAKESKVSQFIFMSSMIVYGDSAPYGKTKIIDEYSIPSPDNFYGDSKWQADVGIRKLGDDTFHTAIVRSPMIYGKGAKGNYSILSKLAQKSLIFPDVKNTRSMLYIDNLCEFISLLVLAGTDGIYFPQNKEYSSTSRIVRYISQAVGKNVCFMKILNPIVSLLSHFPGRVSKLTNKAFGDMVYSQKISTYEGMDYQLIDLETSIILMEGNKVPDWDAGSRKVKQSMKVLFLVNHDVVIYNFRLELVERLIACGYEVHISSPYGEHTDDLVKLGAKFHEIQIDRHGMNPMSEIGLLHEYHKLVCTIRPMAVLTYTIKPNIYGGIVARKAGVSFIANITGLGTSIETGGIKKWIILKLYRLGIYKAQKVFFQNEMNREFMIKNKIVSGAWEVLPGSGVNLTQHYFEPYPAETEEFIFTTIGRIMKDKGIEELLKAARSVKSVYPGVRFRLIGFFDGKYESIVRRAVDAGIVEYINQQKDIHSFIKESHAIIHPSFHEGMSNVLLEAAATGRPVLASDIPGCAETFEEGVTGFGFKPRNSEHLAEVIIKFINLPYEKKLEMGRAGRAKMEREFDRLIVVNKYMDEITKIHKEQ